MISDFLITEERVRIEVITCADQFPSQFASVQVGGRVAYVPQTAWIMNETIRENVCMGKPMDSKRCESASRHVCHLKQAFLAVCDAHLHANFQLGVSFH